ncbi:hypothetical protein G6011_02446 [Alternaria panax]|uniref:CCHC-type domain-containing protein n=1 Tax=Alternaria panax TaxID=48097 RepID=A0AAD4FGI8_9PLEO|nr:hypothetical protein G6011_02446 [Alternaria panax]
MARGPTAVMSNLVANPYPKAKEHVARMSLCEICDRQILTKDWTGHKNSKKHRAAEANEREELEKLKNPGGGFGDSKEFASVIEFANTNNEFSGGATTTTHDGWGSAEDFAATNTSSHNNGGGGDRACYGCGQTGHQKRDCPSGGSGGGGDRACYGCGQTGHQKRDCPQGSGGQACFNCGETGHRKTDCTQTRKPMAGGGGRACHNCGDEGHMSRECDKPRVMKCRNCDEEGHASRECAKPRDWSRVKCRNCSKFGHGEKRCPEPPTENTGGDWGYVGGSTAAAGGWGDAPVKSTGNWADDTTAVVDANTSPAC